MEAIMHGWMGKVLRVDLTEGVLKEERLDPDVARKYLGGRGLGIYYLNKEVDPGCDPLGKENLMVMATGPLTGTKAPTGARYMVTTKSPLTGAITCSNSGGQFPAHLKRTGFDALLIFGAAKKPVYLFIDNETCELRSADHLWGKTTHETTAQLLSETHPKAKVACIGPAAEKGVLYATIMNDKDRAAGRSGVGTVMGAKRLKAIVVRGGQKPAIADADKFKDVQDRVMGQFRETHKDTPPPLRVNGTANTVAIAQAFGVLPTKNFQQGTFDKWENIQASTLRDTLVVGNKACYSCPIGCGRLTKVTQPEFAGEGEGPEYETIYSMGSNCAIDNLSAVTKANYICNELGLDTITMGSTVACAMELYERGYITRKEVGFPLKWGDGHALVKLTKMTGEMKGFGRDLALGSYRLAQKYGHPELAMVSKKQEFAGYDPRAEQGMGLAYATSPIGASHMRGDPAYFEILGIPTLLDPLEWKGRAKWVKVCQDLSAIIDASGICIFFTMRALVEQKMEMRPFGIRDYLEAVTGFDYTIEELAQVAERIINAERLFLVRAGLNRKSDTLPHRLTHEPIPDGPGKGYVCHLEEMLDEYYKEQQWTVNGVPSDKKLKQLGLT
ncbi:aldehyde ferredoxin oxidoreductase family protein [Desulfobacula sp.]